MAVMGAIAALPDSSRLAESPGSGFPSQTLPIFYKRLARVQDSQVLDVGPVCGININFTARRVNRLYVCDMFHRQIRERDKKTPGGVWRHLDYDSNMFHGLLVWDLADRLEQTEAEKFVKLARELVRPGGIMVVFALPELPANPLLMSFVIGDDFRMNSRYQSHLDLPFFFRQSREVERLMVGFSAVKSFVLKSGIREFLFERD